MSLINEALKRAEQEKLRTPGQQHAPSALSPVHAAPAPRRGKQELVALVGLVILVGGWAGWRVLKADSADGSQDQAAGGHMTAPGAPHDPVAAIAAKAAAAHHKSTNAAKYHRPGTRAPKSRMPGPAAPPRRHRAEAHRPAAPVKLQSDNPNEVSADGEPAPPGAEKSVASRFKLSGIMQGPGGAVAVINGYPIHLGEVIGEAKLVRIGRYSVVLEVSGSRVTLRM
ncbi:MAG: hypothetical protein ISS78_03420 [Phycisphaerae bacterium]|nr:hypothetical protein [Phycisphaerae bacterium]